MIPIYLSPALQLEWPQREVIPIYLSPALQLAVANGLSGLITRCPELIVSLQLFEETWHHAIEHSLHDAISCVLDGTNWNDPEPAGNLQGNLNRGVAADLLVAAVWSTLPSDNVGHRCLKTVISRFHRLGTLKLQADRLEINIQI